jgi:glycerol uptake facilitator-like aquaporin
MAANKLLAAFSAFLITIFFVIIAFNQIISMHAGSLIGFSAVGAAWFLTLILLSVAPARDVGRRLLFLALGLFLLIVLNELSKLGLDVTAPKLQG